MLVAKRWRTGGLVTAACAVQEAWVAWAEWETWVGLEAWGVWGACQGGVCKASQELTSKFKSESASKMPFSAPRRRSMSTGCQSVRLAVAVESRLAPHHKLVLNVMVPAVRFRCVSSPRNAPLRAFNTPTLGFISFRDSLLMRGRCHLDSILNDVNVWKASPDTCIQSVESRQNLSAMNAFLSTGMNGDA